MLNNAMTVSEVITALRDQRPDAIVVFGCNYGDRCCTEQALPVTEVISIKDIDSKIVETAYSTSGYAIRECDDDDTKPVTESVVILR